MIRPFLRDAPASNEHAGELMQTVAELRARIELDADDVRALGQLGDVLRILGAYEESEEVLRAAVGGSHYDGNDRARIANLIRLATTLQYRDAHDQALPIFRRALEQALCNREHELLDYAHQHLGKCLAEVGRYGDARIHFEAALTLRKARGDVDLLRSMLGAIALLDSVNSSG